MTDEKVTVYIRGENGVVKPHDLPLPWGVADRLAKGQVQQVEGPSEQEFAEAEPEPAALKRPAVNDPKEAWAAWAKQVDPDLTDEDIKATTKAQLIDRY